MKNKGTKKAREIIADNLYMTIATTTQDGQPWNTPVYFAFDEQYNLFWKSTKTAQHSLNIQENNQLFIVIYDSRVPWGKGEGVFIQARAYEVMNEDEITEALVYQNKRLGEEKWKVDEFMEENLRRVYKAVPEKIWINKDSFVDGKFVDGRQEVTLL